MRRCCCGVVFSLSISILFLYWSYYSGGFYKAPKQLTIISDNPSVQFGGAAVECGAGLWQTIDYTKLPIPEAALRNAVSIPVESHMNFVNGESLHYKMTRSLTPHISGVTVLLLHGAAFSSSTWKELGTMSLVSAFGFPVVAIDLPGFGKSKSRAVLQKSVFLSDVIRVLKLKNPVIVSPSISGIYSIPYVVKHWKNVSGYVPISPVVPAESLNNVCYGAEDSKKSSFIDETCERLLSCNMDDKNIDLSCMKVPVMVVHGEYDKCENSALMCRLPWSSGVEIPKGQHAAYMSNPPLWHKLLYNFLYAVNKTLNCRYEM